jgi:hypothetical protein
VVAGGVSERVDVVLRDELPVAGASLTELVGEWDENGSHDRTLGPRGSVPSVGSRAPRVASRGCRTGVAGWRAAPGTKAAMLEAYVCRAAEWVTREAMQIHGVTAAKPAPRSPAGFRSLRLRDPARKPADGGNFAKPESAKRTSAQRRLAS